MYKLVLCLRYLRTRFLAIICIVSVMLGVATLIVVNSVMSGFSTKLKDRLHGLLSDVVIETPNFNGFPIPSDQMLQMIQNSPAAPYIATATPTIEVFAMINYEPKFGGGSVTRAINLIGVDPKGRAAIGGFAEFLLDPERQKNPSFDLSDDAFFHFKAKHPHIDDLTPLIQDRSKPVGNFLPPPALQNEPIRIELPPPPPPVGKEVPQLELQPLQQNNPVVGEIPLPDPVPKTDSTPKGTIIGWAIGCFLEKDPKTGQMVERRFLEPGDVVNIITVGAGKETPQPVYSPFVVVDYFKSEMAEYDSHMVFVPLEYLQAIRGMEGRVSHIQIKLTDFAHAKLVVNELRNLFPHQLGFDVATWEEKQGALIAAIDVERGILNLLLFLIIGVAGFSILAIFSMIVVEKTRDIGILKSLGASNYGVMSIFMGYGLLLGLVGCVLGTGFGLWITININEIEQFLTELTGHALFDRSLYYFDKIPTNIESTMVFFVNLGSVLTATLFSVLPALRAAMLHPVRALRYE
jgi:lipoprotein-releasing system permease protein